MSDLGEEGSNTTARPLASRLKNRHRRRKKPPGLSVDFTMDSAIDCTTHQGTHLGVQRTQSGSPYGVNDDGDEDGDADHRGPTHLLPPLPTPGAAAHSPAKNFSIPHPTPALLASLQGPRA